MAWESAATLAAGLGEPALAVSWATAAATAEPLREAAAAALVRALAAAGDRAAALAHYDRYRRAIADELGLDPSPALADLHRRLLGPAPTGFALRFVGRDALVKEALTGLATGVVRIAGRSGTGKSRLLEAIAAAVPSLFAAARWAERDEPWSLGRTLLRRLLADDPSAADPLPPRLRTALAHLLPELDAPAGTFDPETRDALVLEAARRLLTDRVVIIDDLQWADPTSVRLLGGVPRLALAYRPDELVHRMPGPPPLVLDALPDAALADLVDDAGIVDAITAETDRTPMAVAEVLRVLHAEGLAAPARGDGRWRSTAASAADRARQVGRSGQRRAIAERVLVHEGPAADLLRLLALLGREAPTGVLAAAAQLPLPATLALLDGLATADLVHLGAHGWRTSHDMVAEVIEAELPAGTRASLHARLATIAADAADQARHWLGAGDPARAAEAFAVAAERALDQVADAEAERLAGTGIDTGAAETAVRARLRQARAQARKRRGDIAGARDDLRAALRDQPPGPGGAPARAAVLAQLAALDSGADDLRRAAELAELALVEAGTDDAARAPALEVASVIDMNLDRPDRAEARAAEALSVYVRTGDSRGAARILDARAMAAFLHGRIADGVAELDRAAHLFESSGDLMRAVTPRSTCGHGRVLLGAPADGLADTERALDAARTLGHPEGQAYALWHRSEARSALGHPAEALTDAREALSIAERLHHRGWTATAWRAIGLAHQCACDPEAALEAFRASLAHSANLDLFACWAAARAALACVALGRLAEAAPLVADALATGPALGRHEARGAAAALAVARADPSAPSLVSTAIESAESAGARHYLPALTALA
ncbi:tetratricopeptide repeat protein [Dactylosporangium darangshiense]|uniref:tetratricopeptide repeat protein n=1 Tax=Dactylosporangium darangshiense TaxID=579108 RepID=UPI0031EAB941